MNLKLLSVLGKQYILQRRLSKHKKSPEPVRLSFAIYEDTKTRDLDKIRSVPPVIIMHGLFGCKQNWNAICKALRQQTNPARKIIALDARNHGESSHSNVHTYEALAMDVKNLIETENIHKISLLGHCMGGRTSMYIALKYPEIVEQLIVLDISPVSKTGNLIKMYKNFSALTNIVIQPRHTLSSVRSHVDAALISDFPDKGARSILLTNLVKKPNGTITWRLNLKALQANYHNIAKFPIEIDSGAQYLGPATFIAGRKSDYLPKKDYTNIKRLFPNAVFHTIKEASHWVHSEKPAELIKLVLEALNAPIRDSKTVLN